jgi:ferritin-like protein
MAAADVNNLEVFKLMEERRVESQRQYELLHERISNMKDEINTDINKSHNLIMGEIKELRGEQRKHAEEVSIRLTNLEKWKWTIVGGAVVIGFFLSGGIGAIGNFLS